MVERRQHIFYYDDATHQVLLKMDALQPSGYNRVDGGSRGALFMDSSSSSSLSLSMLLSLLCRSFKLRGIGHAIKLAADRDSCSHVVSSSGGNAGRSLC